MDCLWDIHKVQPLRRSLTNGNVRNQWQLLDLTAPRRHSAEISRHRRVLVESLQVSLKQLGSSILIETRFSQILANLYAIEYPLVRYDSQTIKYGRQDIGAKHMAKLGP